MQLLVRALSFPFIMRQRLSTAVHAAFDCIVRYAVAEKGVVVGNKKQLRTEGRGKRRALRVHFARTKRAQCVAFEIVRSRIGLPKPDRVSDTRSVRIVSSLQQVR